MSYSYIIYSNLYLLFMHELYKTYFLFVTLSLLSAYAHVDLITIRMIMKQVTFP